MKTKIESMRWCIVAFTVACLFIGRTIGEREKHVCMNEYPSKLDVGIYWAHLTPDRTIEWTKSCPKEGIFATSFDTSRKTVIWTHGLQPNFVSLQDRFWVEDEKTQFLVPWLMLGWNVGIFQWTQFADERLIHFERGEAKIWSPRYFADMRYKYQLSSKKGKIGYADASRDASVGDIFLKHYNAHADQLDADAEIRLIGHSLGSQLVVRVAYMTMELLSARVPDRVTMLDPVFSPDKKGFLRHNQCGDHIEEVLGCYAMKLHHFGTAVEYYKFSFINRCIFSSQEDSNIVRHSAFSQLQINKWGDRSLGSCYSDDLLSSPGHLKDKVEDIKEQMENQHISAVPYYALSVAYIPHRCVLSDDGQTCSALKSQALSAGMPTQVVLDWVNDPNNVDWEHCFHQFDDKTRNESSPTMTLTPEDDLFYIKKCNHVNT